MLKVNDIVINRDNQQGVIERIIEETGQILVRMKPNVWCTYDHAWMLRKV